MIRSSLSKISCFVGPAIVVYLVAVACLKPNLWGWRDARQNELSSVVRFYFPRAGIYCSAVKVGPNQFLTAGHSVATARSEDGTVYAAFKFGEKIEGFANGKTYRFTATDVSVHPSLIAAIRNAEQYLPLQQGIRQSEFKYVDVGIFCVKESSPDLDVMPIRFVTVLEGDSVVLAGWGSRPGTSEDVLTVGTTTVSSRSRTTFETWLNATPGDSGGPALNVSGTQTAIVGVISGGGLTKNAVVSRLDRIRGWLKENLPDSAGPELQALSKRLCMIAQATTSAV